MANYSIKTDLLKIKGAFVQDLKGKTATKQCLIIPLEGSGLFHGAKGVYLNMTASEMREPKYGDTHCVKVNIPTELYQAMTEEERRSIPIIGGLHALESKQQGEPRIAPTPVNNSPAVSLQEQDADEGDDLPF